MRLMKYTLATLALTLFASGCAQRSPRSFVQPNVIKKSDLSGTWYYLQTITDAPPTSSSAFIGMSSELMKVRFDIQEDTIYARRAYEQIQGTEDVYQESPEKYAGMPLAAWHISSQFDIIRDYNATTGEETNRIIESTERPWNDREFVRIDWSKNQATDYVGIGLNFFFDGVTVQPVSYWESDPSSPDALHMERADDKDEEWTGHVGEASYLDVTQKMVVTPDERTECFDGECVTYPACFFSYSTSDCASQVVKVKHAFAKLAPNHDYQPRNWDGKQMQLFGIWDVGLNRLTYNRQYGVTNSGFSRHAARFNLWKKSYNADGTTIDYPARQMRTIPYYAGSSNGVFPPELYSTGQNIIDQWNNAITDAVKLVTAGASPTNGQRVFEWCHNPVKLAANSMGDADPAACAVGLRPDVDSSGNVLKDNGGNPVLHARQGDPRRSTIFWVNQQQDAGPLGYGPPLFDIETGETLSGQAYIYGAAVDTYSARSRDLVLLVTNRLDSDTYTAGGNVSDWVAAMGKSGVADIPQTLTADEVAAKTKAMNFSWAKGQAPEAPITFGDAKAFISSFNARENAMYNSGIMGTSQADIGQSLRDQLKGTDIEAKMITPDIMALGGNSPKSSWNSLSEAEKARISPLRSKAVQQAIDTRLDAMRALGFDFADFADEGIAQRALNLAKEAATMDSEAIRQQLRKDIFKGVTLHEVGHNMGLRHNFRASFDAMNYFPQYWAAREGAAKSATKKYAGLDSNGNVAGVAFGGADCGGARKGTIRPRYVDCPGGATSTDEVTAGVREYQYSSIMDYGAEFNSDLQGLGKYDRAAMKFSYAGDGYVEVFTDVVPAKGNMNTQGQRLESIQLYSNGYGFPSPLSVFGQNLESVNYTTYPNLFVSGAAGLEKRADVPYSEITATGGQTGEKVDAQSRPMVPYFFCSDEFVGNLTCQRFDTGADAYEQAADLISRYNNFYLLNDFKRDRYTFHTSSSYQKRIASRYFDMLRDELTWYALLKADFADVKGADEFFSSEDGWGNFTVAVSNGFDLLGRVITTPSAGTFVPVTAGTSTDYPYDYYKHATDSLPSTSTPGGIYVPMLQGKYIDTTWDFDGCGYYWADQCQTRIGYLLDKVAAIDVLTQSQAYFTGRDTSTDLRRYAIGYIRPFKNQIEEKFGALFAGDYASLAPQIVPGGGSSTIKFDSWSANNEGMTTPKTKLVDPTTGFTIQLYGAVYGLSEFPTTYDQGFTDSTRIFVVGNGEAPIPDSALLAADGVTAGPSATFDPAQVKGAGGTKEWLLWRDPDSAKVYGAHSGIKVADGESSAQVYRNDAAARMLSTANGVSAQVTSACGGTYPPLVSNPTCEAKHTASLQYRDNIDLMRGLQKRFGYARP